jgi:phage shock protein PspC (stress-responsive transcriptional regulator)
MNSLINRLQFLWESYAFGVCAKLGERLGVASWSIRLFFIYASFIAYGSPIIVYLMLAFLMNFKKYLRKRSPIWDF